MIIEDYDSAITTLKRVNYYRLSGYWYPFRQIVSDVRQDAFYPETKFEDIVALYEFDERLRAITFNALMPVELAVRALLGYELGKIDPYVYLDPSKLGPIARDGDKYEAWRKRFDEELAQSREDFVTHHNRKYGGLLPVWVAVEILDWGSLAYLFSFSPENVKETIARTCGLSVPQLASWLKALNLVRNTCAHNGRLFNRVHTIMPKLPRVGRHSDLDSMSVDWSRTFGQLTLIQFLSDRLGVGNKHLLPAVVKTFPKVRSVPISHLGAPSDWQESSPLWR
ncbi:MAG: Abi family protein [Microbacteriaceae bacterium]|nr:Abi family protein [Microbacteriaceae bacterium]